MGVYEYSAAHDAWVLEESWYEPGLDELSVGSTDYVFSEPGWTQSVLFIDATPGAARPDIGGGGGSTPPGGGGAIDPKVARSDGLAEPISSSKSCDDPAALDDIEVTGVSGGLRNWLGGTSTAWAILGNYGGGGSGAAAPGQPIVVQPPENKRAECSDADAARFDHAVSAFALHRSLMIRRFRPLQAPGSIVSIRFSGGGSESYQVLALTSTYPVERVPGSLVCENP